MATQADVRRIALSFSDVEESDKDFAFSVLVNGKPKGIAWCWKERVVPKKPRVPNYSVLVVRVANNAVKDMMMAAEPDKYVIDHHYDGYAAVIFRLADVRVPELRQLIADSYQTQAAPRPRKRR